MAASTNDKITDTFNSANPNVARVTSSRTAGATTLACDNLAGWPTTSKVHFSTYQINTSSAVVAGTQIDWTGIVSGNNIGSLVRKAGATDAGNAIGDVVEMNPTASWGHDLYTGFTQDHNQLDGSHKSLHDTNGLTWVGQTATASAVNYVDIANSATGGDVVISAKGTDTNISIDITPKGSGSVIVPTTTTTNFAGKLGRTAITSSFTTSTSLTDVDVTSLAITITVPAGGRDIKLTAMGGDYEQTGGIGTIYGIIKIKEGSTVLASTNITPSVANFPNGWCIVVWLGAVSAGSHTYKVSVAQNSTGPNYTIGASATDPTILLAEAM